MQHQVLNSQEGSGSVTQTKTHTLTLKEVITANKCCLLPALGLILIWWRAELEQMFPDRVSRHSSMRYRKHVPPRYVIKICGCNPGTNVQSVQATLQISGKL